MTRVLIVEDNATLLDTIAFELEMQAYEVLTAVNGRKAMEILTGADPLPDIIVSDIAMPDLDGYELLEQIRDNEEWNLIPVIFLTAFDSPNAVRLGKDLGVDDYLVKPFEPDDLVVAIENKLKRYRQIHTGLSSDLDKRRQQLLNGITHELRTPLTAIYGSSEMLALNLANISDDSTHRLLALLRSGTRNMRRLVDRIVYVVQIESGHMQHLVDTRSQVVEFARLFSDIQKEGAETSAVLGVTVDLPDGDNGVYIAGVERYLLLLFSEVVDFALKATERGSTVTAKAFVERGHLRFEICFPVYTLVLPSLDTIRENFKQGNKLLEADMEDDLGLALAWVVADLHNGELVIDSTQPQAPIIRVSLPVVAAPVEAN